jgi:hypothetical protein
MSSLYKTFRTDPSFETAGISLNYGENSKGEAIEIRIARAGGANKKYLERMEAKTKPLRRQIQTETVSRAALDAVVREVFAETVVLGWSGVEDENGKPLTFSKEACIKVFTDLPDLFLDIQEQAQKSVLFRAEVMEADAKN